MPTIEIHPYDPTWPDQFAVLGKWLRDALGPVAHRIDHIGSTAVPGLDAKPIIDLQISVAALHPDQPFRLPMERLGLVFRPENPDRTKRYFRESSGQPRTHIHVRLSGSWSEQFNLLFRDFMRLHPMECQRYLDRKKELAQIHGANREAYSRAKEPEIWNIMMLADRWSQQTGWTPGLSDA